MVKLLSEPAHTFNVGWVSGHLGQAIAGDSFKEQARVVFAFIPKFGIQISKDASPFRRPTPPVVPVEALQRFQGNW